ncbi:hypothetical protein ARMSODRAFT_973049 [Armillaria solidipes]|uniref:Uncharacterized protein n=1 Tax=Armillaria solidipes TaxID=1076256 RepID=A0A2H3C2A3_9AGAR|nr:hypothetical protein ARMSODRAFT_973049 [Armillaria solidipes]
MNYIVKGPDEGYTNFLADSTDSDASLVQEHRLWILRKLLRHENLALMSACSLKSTHSGIPSIDAGIFFNVYLGDESNAAYVPPVGDVYSGLNDLKMQMYIDGPGQVLRG